MSAICLDKLLIFNHRAAAAKPTFVGYAPKLKAPAAFGGMSNWGQAGGPAIIGD
jgi:hypothetical protein